MQPPLFQSILLFCAFATSLPIGSGQKRTLPLPNDSIMRREMAFFTLSDTFTTVSDVQLTTIPLWYADASVAALNTGRFFDDGRYLHFEFSQFDPKGHQITYKEGQDSMIAAIDGKPCWGIGRQLPKRYLKQIRLIIHSHLEIDIPENACEGIFEPPVYQCLTKKDRKRPQPFFKFYVSKNGFMYLYLLSGQGKHRYETTWVIHGSTYYKRFIRAAPE